MGVLQPLCGGAEPLPRPSIDDTDPAEGLGVDELCVDDREEVLVQREVATNGGVDTGRDDNAAVRTAQTC